jgi:hypothetical protein
MSNFRAYAGIAYTPDIGNGAATTGWLSMKRKLKARTKPIRADNMDETIRSGLTLFGFIFN